MASSSSHPQSYKEAGVDTEAAESALAGVAKAVRATHDKRVGTDPTGYSGILHIEGTTLALSTDGVGTKILLHLEMDTLEAAGQDCVAMVVNDLVASGARPQAFLDYYATGKLEPERFQRIIEGLARAVEESGATLVGGETAEMPGLYPGGEVDLVGFGVGTFPTPARLYQPQVDAQEGDLLVGLASSGFHSNGYSLVRALVSSLNIDLHQPRSGGSVPLGLQLTEPTRLYPRAVAGLQEACGDGIKGIAHITGGGLIRNIPRLLPPHLDGVVNPATFARPPVLDWLVARSGIPLDEAYRTFNMGLGLVVVLSPTCEKEALNSLAALPYPSWIVGCLESGTGQAQIG
ncbi:phosphoribosylformylglycinamidine cyclo-ligase [bacterium]|nr:phosphoribosylformylglycinamidine cyclo-ligase [bacterium]